MKTQVMKIKELNKRIQDLENENEDLRIEKHRYFEKYTSLKRTTRNLLSDFLILLTTIKE